MGLEPPPNLRSVVSRMRYLSELMLDLAYSAALYHSKELADDVLELEQQMDSLRYQGKLAAMLSVRDLQDAKSMLPILRIITSTDKISDAAGDIAKIPMLDLGIPAQFKALLLNTHESVIQLKLEPGSPLIGSSISAAELSYPGIKVLAIKRGPEWIVDPAESEKLGEGDLVFLRGVRAAWQSFSDKLGIQLPQEAPTQLDPGIQQLIELLVEMKDSAELSLDLAYLSVLDNSDEAAMEVKLLESQLDRMHHELELLVMNSAKQHDPRMLRGLLHLSQAFEQIADAAYEIADTVLRDLIPHRILGIVFGESRERIFKLEITQDSEFCGCTPLQIHAQHPELSILGLNREGKWIYMPIQETIQPGDVLILKSLQPSK